MKPLPRDFYARSPTAVARELIGKIIVRKYEKENAVLKGRIVETEAYGGSEDPASHAFRGKTNRNSVMFGEAGHAYVYFTYGFHHCLNFVTGRAGKASAVLVRAVEPISGIEVMSKLRKTKDFLRLTNGPGKICQATAIDLSLNGCDVTRYDSPIFVTDSRLIVKRVLRSQRIGIKNGLDKRWRFYAESSEFVSR